MQSVILSYSFAGHLLKQGISLRYIQKFSGLGNLRTTKIYIYVSKRSIE